MYDKLLERQSELYNRLDNLEGCADNPVYALEVKKSEKNYPILTSD